MCNYMYYAGFYEDADNHHFGLKPKRGKPKPASDFYFEFVMKVVAGHPASTGFPVKVFPESDTATIIPEPRYKYIMKKNSDYLKSVII